MSVNYRVRRDENRIKDSETHLNLAKSKADGRCQLDSIKHKISNEVHKVAKW